MSLSRTDITGQVTVDTYWEGFGPPSMLDVRIRFN